VHVTADALDIEPLDEAPAPALHEIVDRLARRFPEVPRRSLAELVRLAHEQYHAARVRSFIPLLVEKQVARAVQLAAPTQPGLVDR
jgi:hypothetical protein